MHACLVDRKKCGRWDNVQRLDLIIDLKHIVFKEKTNTYKLKVTAAYLAENVDFTVIKRYCTKEAYRDILIPIMLGLFVIRNSLYSDKNSLIILNTNVI